MKGWYESIDLSDANHPQTILAYQMNGRPFPAGNGGWWEYFDGAAWYAEQ
jgi:DMSO/TMAO reductase YedYZ molybdopterin-dependent catalytic subunit